MKMYQEKFINALKALSLPFKVANTEKEVCRVLQFQEAEYKHRFPEILFDKGKHQPETNDVFIYTEDCKGAINSTATITIGNIPNKHERSFFASVLALVRKNQGYIYVSRFINSRDDNQDLAVKYLRAFYSVSKSIDCHLVLGLVKRKDLELHKKLGVTVIDPDTGINYGGQNIFSAVMWQLDHLTNLGYNKLKHQRSESPEPKIDKKLNKANWQSYALPFSAVQTGVQSELQKESNKYFYGRVGDFGCGSGRMGTLAQHNNNVSHYLGIDACPEMVSIAKQAFERYNYDKCQVIHRYIEHTNDFQFDVGVSLNSLYSWENPARVLKHIYTLLKPGGLLILADPSPNISIDILEKEEEKHQIFNNYYDEFKRFNIEFIHRYEYRFLTMDKLIELTRSCGFNVKECHQRFYHGGMNFIVLEKPQ